jgi:tartrate dehydratase beta subunit/fumarate hydratase class I family protein
MKNLSTSKAMDVDIVQLCPIAPTLSAQMDQFEDNVSPIVALALIEQTGRRRRIAPVVALKRGFAVVDEAFAQEGLSMIRQK